MSNSNKFPNVSSKFEIFHTKILKKIINILFEVNKVKEFMNEFQDFHQDCFDLECRLKDAVAQKALIYEEYKILKLKSKEKCKKCIQVEDELNKECGKRKQYEFRLKNIARLLQANTFVNACEGNTLKPNNKEYLDTRALENQETVFDGLMHEDEEADTQNDKNEIEEKVAKIVFRNSQDKCSILTNPKVLVDEKEDDEYFETTMKRNTPKYKDDNPVIIPESLCDDFPMIEKPKRIRPDDSSLIIQTTNKRKRQLSPQLTNENIFSSKNKSNSPSYKLNNKILNAMKECNSNRNNIVDKSPSLLNNIKVKPILKLINIDNDNNQIEKQLNNEETNKEIIGIERENNDKMEERIKQNNNEIKKRNIKEEDEEDNSNQNLLIKDNKLNENISRCNINEKNKQEINKLNVKEESIVKDIKKNQEKNQSNLEIPMFSQILNSSEQDNNSAAAINDETRFIFHTDKKQNERNKKYLITAKQKQIKKNKIDKTSNESDDDNDDFIEQNITSHNNTDKSNTSLNNNSNGKNANKWNLKVLNNSLVNNKSSKMKQTKLIFEMEIEKIDISKIKNFNGGILPYTYENQQGSQPSNQCEKESQPSIQNGKQSSNQYGNESQQGIQPFNQCEKESQPSIQNGKQASNQYRNESQQGSQPYNRCEKYKEKDMKNIEKKLIIEETQIENDDEDDEEVIKTESDKLIRGSIDKCDNVKSSFTQMSLTNESMFIPNAVSTQKNNQTNQNLRTDQIEANGNMITPNNKYQNCKNQILSDSKIIESSILASNEKANGCHSTGKVLFLPQDNTNKNQIDYSTKWSCTECIKYFQNTYGDKIIHIRPPPKKCGHHGKFKYPQTPPNVWEPFCN